MLGTMRLWERATGVRAGRMCAPSVLLAAAVALGSSLSLGAQTCTTQAHFSEQQRGEIGGAALRLASAVQAGDAARVQAETVPAYAGDAGQAAFLVRNTASHIGGESLEVTQAYLLDASGRKAGDATEADFACPLAGTADETDFGIGGLPPGRFAFAMVEARGANPWLLSFLLEQEGGGWKMAGFYPHARVVAGHDGLWYWTTARADAKANRPWVAWLLYNEAEHLLRPANFVSSGNLDKLFTEQRTAAPQALSNGVSEQTPLTLQGEHGAVYQLTDLRAQPSDDARALNLVLQMQADPALAPDAATARNLAAAQAFLAAHPELRTSFSNILVIAERSGAEPITTERPIDQVAR